jgi:DNA-binding cell septation regulator SpoVG
LNSYPRVRKITLNQQEYDAKTLVQLMSMFEKNRWVLPHSRRKISDKEIFKIIAKSIENKTLQKKAEKVIDKYFKAKEKEEQEIRSLINQLPSWTF